MTSSSSRLPEIGAGQIAADVAKERGLTLVVQKGATLVYDSNAEITDAVLQKLDAKLPSMKLQ